MRRLGLAVALAALTLSGCGGGPSKADRVVQDAEEHLASVRSGRMALSLSGTALSSGRRTDPVGFRVEGPFQFGSRAYPVLDLTYTRLRGSETSERTLRSDGASVWVVADGAITPLQADAVASLRQADTATVGIGDLDLDAWFEHATVEGGIVTGEVAAAALLGDLQRLAAEVDGRASDAELDEDAAARLQEKVRSSSIELRTAGPDHELRSLRATVDFGRSAPAAVDEALADYSSPRLELRLTFEPLGRRLRVAPPGGD